MKERDYWLGFSACPGIGPHKFKALLNYFSSAEDAWKASVGDLQKTGIGEKTATKFVDFRKHFSIDSYKERLEKKKVQFLILSDNNYSELLKQIKNPPILLYVLSNFRNLSDLGNLFNRDKAIGIVGTRRITGYGREVTELFCRELVNNSFTIVSGLALGVDAVAHKTALETNGKTIAVLGCGADLCYPSSNQKLYESIIDNGGAIVSEYPLSQLPTIGSFPSRNRIIAGLSSGVLVTEGAEDSGSLITADYALEFNRKVFAIPGPITSSLSKGPYKLISNGAKLVTSVNEILNEFNIDSKIKNQRSNIKNKGETKEENLILEILENEPLHFDQLIKMTKIESSKLGVILSMMELKGLIESKASGLISIIS